jgi:fructan beta-fructosidase
VMTLYVELDKKHTIHFLTSPNLKDWTVRSRTEGFYECPDFFELPLSDDPKTRKWVLTAANSEYMLGTFDGTKFTPETPKLRGHSGRGFYAAQTFSDIPDGRRIQIGWLKAPSPGMPFNQAMTVPLEVKLAATPNGPRLAWAPVKELDALRGSSAKLVNHVVKPGPALDLKTGELLDVVALLEPGKASEVSFSIRGIAVLYNVAKQELSVNGHRAAAPLLDGKLDLRILADRTAFEVFASGGLTYMPMPAIPKADNRTVSVSAQGDGAIFRSLVVYDMKSIWTR